MTPPEITELIHRWGEGDQDAGNHLFPLIYEELRRIARQYFRNERPGHTLQPTGLVNELYLKLSKHGMSFQDRSHFYAVAARQMRRLLIDHARANSAEKRGGDAIRTELAQEMATAAAYSFDALAVDEAIEALERLDARIARVVELRYFVGLTEAEAAEALNISVATLKRDWQFAYAWLRARLSVVRQKSGGFAE
jgi:RNA polymerase sigma factor (TIGR02999 family)